MAENPRQADAEQDEDLLRRISKSREQSDSALSELVGRRLLRIADQKRDREPPQLGRLADVLRDPGRIVESLRQLPGIASRAVTGPDLDIPEDLSQEDRSRLFAELFLGERRPDFVVPPESNLQSEDITREPFQGPTLADLGFSPQGPLLGEPGAQVPVTNMLEALNIFRGPGRVPDPRQARGFDPFNRGRSVPFDFGQRA